MIDRVSDVSLHRHDVADGDSPVVGPRARIEFLRVAEHARDFRHRRKQLRLDLRRAAGHNNPHVGLFAFETPDALPRLAHRFCRHRTGVHHYRVVMPGGSAADYRRFGDVQPTAEGDDVGTHGPLPIPPPLAGEGWAGAKIAGSNLPANSNSTGPVIST